MWTKRDEAFWNELMNWEQQLVSNRDEKVEEQGALASKLAASLPDDIKSRFFSQADQAAEWLWSFLQNDNLEAGVKNQIIGAARIFQDDIETIDQLHRLTIDQLQYINRQRAFKNHAAAAIQGAASGTGNFIPALTDFLILSAMQLRTIQTTALSYGFDTSLPFERENILHLFYISLLPESLKADGWAKLITEVEEKTAYIDKESWGTNEAMLQEPMKHILKLAAVRILRRPSGIPVISMALSAGANFLAVKQATVFAERYYQYRYLYEKKNRE
ncbi:EcsC family protein [Domibacillus indicus]|uniref:EcsC family protein n=1 Tax=Domibacillus indicus TaxID=1437523 RepID=UPI000617C2D9|nr:EcsC family protein [Domibacillus indicus]